MAPLSLTVSVPSIKEGISSSAWFVKNWASLKLRTGQCLFSFLFCFETWVQTNLIFQQKGGIINQQSLHDCHGPSLYSSTNKWETDSRERNCKRKSDFPLWDGSSGVTSRLFMNFQRPAPPTHYPRILGVQLYPAYPPTTILYPSPRTKTFQKGRGLKWYPTYTIVLLDFYFLIFLLFLVFLTF